MIPAVPPGPVMATAPERISVDRLLALGVTRTWQEAVAVAHAASSLAEVSAVLYGIAPLVTAGSCILTTAGDVELPETTDAESESAVLELLQQLLKGVETPAEVEALAFGYSTSDVTTRLSAFAGDNRRAMIAKLAARAAAAGAATPVSVAREPAPLVTARAPVAAAAAAPAVAQAVARISVAPSTAPETARLEPEVSPAKPPKVEVRPEQPRKVDASPKPATVAVSPPTPSSETASKPKPAKADIRPLKRPGAAGGHQPDGPRGPLNEELQRLRRKIVEAAGNTSLKIRLLRVLLESRRWMATADGRLAAGALLGAVTLAVLAWISTSAARPGEPLGVRASFRGFVPVRATAAMRPPSRFSLDASESSGRRGSVSPPAVVALAPPSPPPAAPDLAPVAIGPVVAAMPSAPAPAAAVPEPATTPMASVAAGEAFDSTSRVYSSANDDVVPPALTRQQLSSLPVAGIEEPPEGWPYLDVLVDEFGAVENVRLIARAPLAGETLYHQRMLVAAAKAWRFTPASRDGRPVRYRLRVTLER